MTIYAAPIDVINAAIMTLGAKPIQSLTSQKKEAQIARAHYEPMVHKALTRHAWSWAGRNTDVVYSTMNDQCEFLFPLPEDLLLVRWVKYDGCHVNIEEFDDGRLVYHREGPLRVHHTWRVPEARWPANFAEAIRTDLYSRLVRALLNDFVEAERQEANAERMFRMASAQDKNQIRGRDITQSSRALGAWKGRRRRASFKKFP